MSDAPALALSIQPPLDDERAVETAVRHLTESAEAAGWRIVDSADADADFELVVRLAEGVTPEPMIPAVLPGVEEQSYSIRTLIEAGSEVVRLTGGGVLGAAYGIEQLGNLIRSHGSWPPADADESPRFPQRITFGFMGFPASEEPPYVDVAASRKALESMVSLLDDAIHANVTMLQVLVTKYLIKWGDEIGDARAEACREIFREFVAEAHARHLRIYAMDDEFLYVPAWLERTGATLSTDDPKFWEAMKSKYRDLLESMPELDGIGSRVGEVTPQGDIMAWDLVHTPDDRSIEANYRQFLKSMHEVVVGECNRLYLHRVWQVSTWEQSSVPEIYRRTLTDDVPTEDFIASIKITTGDQWEWQPINPTFGQTPHATAAQVETTRAQDYFSGPPDFAVEFAQAGLEYALEHGATAASVNLNPLWGESLWSAMNYITFRLAWNPYRSVRDITAEWATAQFGTSAGPRVAEMLLDLDDIYRDGFHIRGPSYHTWEPLVHVRTGFVCMGNPFIDGGRGQYRFLRDLYLMAKPELETGLATMEESTRSFERWHERFRGWMKDSGEPERGKWLDEILTWGESILRLNLCYVDAFMRFYDYADASRAGGDTRYRDRAAAAIEALEKELVAFNESRATSTYKPGFSAADNTQGIDVFLEFARPGLDDLAAVIDGMRSAPDDAGVRGVLDAAAQADVERLEQHPDAPIIVEWKGRIDCRDIVRIGLLDDSYVVEHYLGDPGSAESWSAEPPSDEAGVPTVELRLGGHRGWAYVLEAPSEENNHTISIMLEDSNPGFGSYDFVVRWTPA